jgi:hypothetical protein
MSLAEKGSWAIILHPFGCVLKPGTQKMTETWIKYIKLVLAAKNRETTEKSIFL